MNNIRDLVTFDIRKKSLPYAYTLWALFGVFGIHRLYSSGARAFYIQFSFNLICFILLMLGALSNSINFTVFMLAFIWTVIPIWLLVDFYFVFRWVKYYNIKLYYEIFGENS